MRVCFSRQVFAYSTVPRTKQEWQRLFALTARDYQAVWAGGAPPGADKGPAHAEKYCTKEKLFFKKTSETITDEWYAERCQEHVKKQGKRNDLLALKRAMDEGRDPRELMMDDQFFGVLSRNMTFAMNYYSIKRQRTAAEMQLDVQVFYGGTGTGKTRKAYEELGMDPLQTWTWTPGAGSTFFDGYTGQDHVIFDEFRGQIPLGQMLRLIDIYPVNVQVKGSTVAWSPKKIIITSPVCPEDWYNTEGKDYAAAQIRRRLSKVIEFKKLN